MDNEIRIRRVTVEIEVIADGNETAGRWVSALLQGHSDQENSPIVDFDVKNVEEL